MSTTSTGCTRREFLAAVAAGTAGVGTLAAMGECAAPACAAAGAALAFHRAAPARAP